MQRQQTETLVSSHLDRARARLARHLELAHACTHADDIVTHAASAKAAGAVVDALEDLRFELLGA